MSSEGKVREFWLYDDDKKPLLHVGIHPESGGLHVIEMSAYLALQEKCAALEAEKEQFWNAYISRCKHSDSLREQNETLQRELDAIRFENTTLQHTIQEMQIEIDQLKEAIRMAPTVV